MISQLPHIAVHISQLAYLFDKDILIAFCDKLCYQKDVHDGLAHITGLI